MKKTRIKLVLWAIFFMHTTTVFAQFNYEKKFRDGVVKVYFEKYSGPMTLSVKPTGTNQIDTIFHTGKERMDLYGYFISDAYLSGDTLLLAIGDVGISVGGRIDFWVKKDGKWTWTRFKENVLQRSDLKKNHKIEFIDSKRIKTIVDGIEKMYELDYKKMKTKQIMKQE
jgi:hypothetical protein